MAETLGSKFDPAHNNFDALRLGAALVVLLSHCYSLTGASWEPISTWLGYGYGATISVDIFFVLSGFLVMRSLESHDLAVFIRGRMLRIIPGLAFVTVVEAIVIAPLFYEGAVSEYFHNGAFDHLKNILVFGEDPEIYHVFSRLPFPYVNGSLWTLPVETSFYLLLPVVALAASHRRWIVLLALVLSMAAEPLARWQGLDDVHFGGFLFQTVRLFSVAETASYFLAGVAAWVYRDRIPWSGGGAGWCLLLLFAAHGTLAAPTVLKFTLPYLVLFVGMQGGLGSRLKRRIGDLSYGVYLFGYPLTNVVISLSGQRLGAEAVAALATPAALAAAWISWRLVEAPTLAFKRRRGRIAPPAPVPGIPGRFPRFLQPPADPGGNFMVLRLFAVGLVIYGNGLLLTGATPTSYWGAPMSRIGIDLLFCISGYLAVDAWQRRPTVASFATRRAMRFLPGLAACVLLTVLAMGPLATVLPLRQYALSGLSREYLANIVLVQKLWLPGVFQGQQWSGTVNPMLWTLLAGVALWGAIALAGALSPRRVMLVAAAALCVLLGLLHGPASAGHPLHARLVEFLIEAPFFVLAALYRLLEKRLPGLWRADLAMLLFAANWIVATWLGASDLPLEWLSLPYMAVCFGRMSAPVLGWVGRLGNPTYGLYLYAFPLQQSIVAFWPDADHPVLACGVMALAAGYLSWHLIERPALAWSGPGGGRFWTVGRAAAALAADTP